MQQNVIVTHASPHFSKGAKLLTRTHLRRRRQWLGLTQQAVADRLGIHRTIYNRIERGHPYPVTLEMARKLAEVLETDVDEIFPVSKTS